MMGSFRDGAVEETQSRREVRNRGSDGILRDDMEDRNVPSLRRAD
jgi:hypothetical protein